MENILPFLLAMAALAYKIYDNFKQEQEKAKKRTTGGPDEFMSEHQKASPTPSKEVTVREIKPKPVVIEEEYYPHHPYEPQYRTVYEEQRPVKNYSEPVYRTVKAEPLRVRENINPERPVQEVRRTRAIHQPHKHKVVVYTEERVEHPYANFDLHDAVVKEAILNRPQF